MKKWLVLSGIVIVIAAFTTVTNENRIIDPEEVKKAVNKSLPLLQTTSHLFFRKCRRLPVVSSPGSHCR